MIMDTERARKRTSLMVKKNELLCDDSRKSIHTCTTTITWPNNELLSLNPRMQQTQGTKYSNGVDCLCVSPPDQGDWNGNQRAAPGKAPLPSRGAKTSYREHPYQQY